MPVADLGTVTQFFFFFRFPVALESGLFFISAISASGQLSATAASFSATEANAG